MWPACIRLAQETPELTGGPSLHSLTIRRSSPVCDPQNNAQKGDESERNTRGLRFLRIDAIPMRRSSRRPTRPEPPMPCRLIRPWPIQIVGGGQPGPCHLNMTNVPELEGNLVPAITAKNCCVAFSHAFNATGSHRAPFLVGLLSSGSGQGLTTSLVAHRARLPLGAYSRLSGSAPQGPVFPLWWPSGGTPDRRSSRLGWFPPRAVTSGKRGNRGRPLPR